MDGQWMEIGRKACLDAAAVTISSDTNQRKQHIWAFDEPETHLYPTAQRHLFEVIKEISTQSIQTIVSTHSTVFIDRADLNAISIVRQNSHYYSEICTCNSVNEIFQSLDLRNSDFLFFDKFLIVEGETELYLIPAMYKMYTGRTLNSDNIQLIHLRGASKWHDQKAALEQVLNDFQKPNDNLIFLLDNDQKMELGQSAITSSMHFIGAQDIEDSLDNEIWQSVTKKFLSNIEIGLSLDRIQSIKDSIPDDVKISAAEKFLPKLNREIKALVELTKQIDSGIERDFEFTG
ncbi:MAG: hypothetical protein EOP48_33050, partial [Sphingobacteriales bacterium]